MTNLITSNQLFFFLLLLYVENTKLIEATRFFFVELKVFVWSSERSARRSGVGVGPALACVSHCSSALLCYQQPAPCCVEGDEEEEEEVGLRLVIY
jgi:hypothetical protein